MPAFRRWRVFALLLIFIFTSLYYLTNTRNTWNYGYTPYVTPTPLSAGQPHDHWRPLPVRYAASALKRIPPGVPNDIPAVQAPRPSESLSVKKERLRRRDAVKQSFVHSWTGYKKHAWLRDEVTPVTGNYRDTFGGWAATLVDSLDSLWIMGLKEDFEAAVEAATTIDFTTTDEEFINVFETTIRYMGGFLAAYDISEKKYPALLKKAVEVGQLLMSCFDTPNRLPITRWDWGSYVKGNPQTAPKRMLVSELGSLTLEFTRLSQLTGNPVYFDAVQRISDLFEASQNQTMLPGMWPVTVDAEKPDLSTDTFFTLGGMSDSLYEYLPKQYLLLGGLMSQSKTMYEKFIEVAKEHLFFRIYNKNNKPLTVSGDVRINVKSADDPIKLNPRGQHLTCFAGGMVALASRIFSRPNDLRLAEELTDGCVWAYDSGPHGVAPEIFTVMPCPKEGECKWDEKIWHHEISELYSKGSATETQAEIDERVLSVISNRRLPAGFTAIEDRKYILRPEAIESVFIMSRITGDLKWQEAAWRMFEAIEKLTRTPVSAAAIVDVTVPEGEAVKMDSMESFWLAETLKYFYLVFEEWDVVSLDDYVLNTEAHPLKRPK